MFGIFERRIAREAAGRPEPLGSSNLVPTLVPTLVATLLSLAKPAKEVGPATGCGVALDRALHPVEQRPQFIGVDGVRSHKVANDWIGQQLVD